jgi:hypothetical protein
MFREFKHLVEWDTPEYLFGVIEMIVCSYARIFIGTKASTFSGYIQRFVCIHIDSLLFHFISIHCVHICERITQFLSICVHLNLFISICLICFITYLSLSFSVQITRILS